MSKDIILSLINRNNNDDNLKKSKSINAKNEFIKENEISSKLKMEISEIKK